VRLELADSEIDRAHNALQKARRCLGGYRPPCMDHPRLFDPQNGEDGESWVQYGRRAAVAAELCVTACHVLRQCQELYQVDPELRGIVAGRVILDPEEDKKGGRRATAKT
jgi:hypothetical protein